MAFNQFEAGSDKLYYPSVAVWLRIYSGNETVDLVPATLSYDNLDGKRVVSDDDILPIASGGDTPLLRFFPKNDEANGIRFNGNFFKDHNDQQRDVEWDFQTYSANDPRYNWAPEDWSANDDEKPQNMGWLEKVQEFQKNHKEWCDTDIFMSVSDQGYLQSIYELMMIPQISPIANIDITIGKMQDRAGRYNGERKFSFDNAVNFELMWRTYKSDAFLYDIDFRNGPRSYEGSEYWRDWGTIEDLKVVDSAAGMRVNPYTDITNLFVGALANLPRDWWAAGTNYQDVTRLKAYMDPGNGNRLEVQQDYLFARSVTRRDVTDMAHFMMKEFRHDEISANCYTNSGWKHWSEVMDVWNWLLPEGEEFDRYNYTGQDDEMANLMADLSSVDRKFLYGFLKGCFGNKSQLFLIFVRAEPSDGGGGGRAVALVWRDPESNYNDDNADLYLQKTQPNNEFLSEETWRLRNRDVPPHRTRVLFYRQLD